MEMEEGKGKRGGGPRRAAMRKAARAAAGGAEKKRMGRGGRAAAGAAGVAAAAAAAAGATVAARELKGRGGVKARGGRAGGKGAVKGHGKGHGNGLGKLVGLRRRRMFDSGELRLVVLKLIGDEPRHGYELIKSIEELTGGGYAPSPGVIYPTLTLLEETGHAASEDDGEGRRRFSITGSGSAELVEKEEQVGKLFARLSTAGEKHKRTDAMPVRRAMTNLKVALQDRLSQGEVSDDTLLQVAALIDDAAQKIERLA
ncbi:PadR family transcriptional regulator [Sphingomonas sp. CCH5-D11]|uniref:PadR family transcriptional regulator n=1 Tax=Sphingomonas sp. CCH5-D11 TaxID=1768786 RepID=UPI000ADBEB86|nr:PadR family transcriptional regulator [Sphingomonas sp. CCH5-D11]